MFFAVPTVVLLAITFVVVTIILFSNSDKQENGKRAPGPKSWPIIGGIPFMAKFADSTAAFCALAKQYGHVASIKLGSMDCVVLSGYKTFRKVLCSSSFDARPDFARINMMFGGNRNNSLAFTDYTESHHKSRNIIAAFSLARNTSSLFENLDTVSTENIVKLVEDIKSEANINAEGSVPLKTILSKSVAKTFLTYFCSTEVSAEDPAFEEFIQSFDAIFEEVNEPCVGDILPYLMKFINKDHVVEASKNIRHFVHEQCLKPREEQRRKMKQGGEDENNNVKAKEPAPEVVDLLDAFLDAAEKPEDGLTLDQALFALEDILGGHTAVCHTIIRMLIYIAQNPEVQAKIREETMANCTGVATMTSKLQYTEATAWECLRFISSAIVPHKATEDTEIDGWQVKKDTVVFFNNYDLHFSPELWDQPETFMPERFLADGGSRLLKPDYFVPFSTGRRVCLGQKILMKMSVTIIANLCQSFQIRLDPTENYSVTRCCLAVGNKPYRFQFRRID